ncbi:MAG: helix-turn-helix domain-containing protein [Rhodococcus sp. (in: high G+C Gram-positive bacteria)]
MDTRKQRHLERIRNAFAAEIRAARARRGVTQAEVAKSSGMSRATIARLEAGERTLDMAQLFDLCEALGVDPGEILNAVQRQAAEE